MMQDKGAAPASDVPMIAEERERPAGVGTSERAHAAPVSLSLLLAR